MDAQTKTIGTFNQDRGFSLSQKQYDLILNYLKSGVMPASRDIREAEMGKSDGIIRKRVFNRFRSIARRLRYRPSDNSLIFHANSKIVLPSTQFADVIKEAHQSKGDKHLNITKTIEKLSEKYTTGCRQFGINEEMVREVIRSCSQGSCAKYYTKTTEFKSCKKKLKLDTSAPVSSTITVETQGTTLKPLRIKPKVQKTLDSTYVAIPCLIPTSGSVTQGSFPLRQCLLFTGTCHNKNLSNFVPCTVSSSETQTVGASKGSIMSQLIFVPGPTPMPNSVKLLTTPQKSANNSNSTMGLDGQSVQPDQFNNSCQHFISIAPLTNLQVSAQSDTSNTDTPLTPTPGISSSLTNISVGTINLQQQTPEADKNNNNSFDKDHHMTEDQYTRFVEGIKDMQPDVCKALAGSWSATEQLNKRITFLEGMVRHLKQLSETVGMDSDNDQETD